MNSAEIREMFLAFFEAKGHRRVASSSLVPANDPSLMFTNSGMIQFKDVFLGFDKRDYRRATTSQRCLRAGGKHNDLENVGYTARHHTFFEMLGNFSFGDYFKADAIPYAWELLTSKDWFGLDPRHLWITVFGGGRLFGNDSPAVPVDDEARTVWERVLQEAGFSAVEAHLRVTDIGTNDNFWMMGDTGPCGPCSEIFYNRNRQAERFEGEDPARADECVEIWNLVFMQFNRDEQGFLKALPAPCVDTGMGLERMCSIVQNVPSNYETDLLARLVAVAAAAIAKAGGSGLVGDEPSLRVIADHIRAAAFLIADGVAISNEGRGYVLRRIIRRALRHGYKLGAREPFFASLAESVVELLGAAHPVLQERMEEVATALTQEEKGFAHTLHIGMKLLTERVEEAAQIDGYTAFVLYDTYGFPLDMTQDYARDSGLRVDVKGFDECMAKQRERSRRATSFAGSQQVVVYEGPATDFLRSKHESEAEIIAIIKDGVGIPVAQQGEEVLLVLNPTPFYAEAGGQLGDTGAVRGADGEAEVLDTVRIRTDVHAVRVCVRNGDLAVGEMTTAAIDGTRRSAICRAHSATHLLHAALRQVLSADATQRGSLVAPDRLRFDFTHDKALHAEQIAEVERIVNQQIVNNSAVRIEELPFDQAIERGAMALFGERYGSVVRMVTIDPDYSVELCGGTHVARAGDIGFVSVRAEEAIAAGVRRINALSATPAVTASRQQGEVLARIAVCLKSPLAETEAKIEQLQVQLREQNRMIELAARDKALAQVAILASQAKHLGGLRAIIGRVDGIEMKLLREMATRLSSERAPIAVMLGGHYQDQAILVARVDAAGSTNVDASLWIRQCASLCGGRGGGKAAYAQAGGGDPAKLAGALKAAEEWLVAVRKD